MAEGGQQSRPGPAAPRVAAAVLRAYAGARPDRIEVRFSPGPTVLARPGESLLRIAEANQVPLESGCLAGVCGADAVQVLAGGEHLSPPAPAEAAALRRLGLPRDCRMACTARVRGPVTVAPGIEASSQKWQPAPAQLTDAGGVRRVVIVGSGVAGVTAALELRERQPELDITLVGAEPHDFYNRMVVNRLLTGPTTVDRLALMRRDWAELRGIRCLRGVRAHHIDSQRGLVTTDSGALLSYDRLLLATGAESRIPPIDGFGIPGTFVMRTIEDALQLQEHIRDQRCRRVVVIGGGLLGLEAAASLSQTGVRVSVVEQAPWPMPRQLDGPAGAVLAQLLADLGIKVVLDAHTRRIQRAERVQGVELADGQRLKADAVLVAAGIAPNVALAGSAGLAIKDGIAVDDFLRTSDPRIFAAGDAAAHEGRVQGLWAVGVEQGQVAAINMLGGACRYRSAVPPTRLKVPGIDVISVGEVAATGDDVVAIRAPESDERRYRKLVVRGGRACGAILVGYHELHDAVAEAVVEQRDLGAALPALERGDWSAVACAR